MCICGQCEVCLCHKPESQLISDVVSFRYSFWIRSLKIMRKLYVPSFLMNAYFEWLKKSGKHCFIIDGKCSVLINEIA